MFEKNVHNDRGCFTPLHVYCRLRCCVADVKYYIKLIIPDEFTFLFKNILYSSRLISIQ